MAASSMSRRDRTLVAAALVVVMYGVLAMLWFGGRATAWEKSRKAYNEAKVRLERQKRLIASKDEWNRRAAEVQVKMPMVEEGVDPTTRWQRLLGNIGAAHHVQALGKPGKEEEHGGVWELPITDVKYEASLSRLVSFIFALDNAEGGMFDVREIDISSKNNGFLAGKFTLTCAYMKTTEKTTEGSSK